jgi:phospholipid/cholesterol/gamma-HCH transport system substrate-binding protein
MRVRVDIEVLKSVPINSGTYASIAFQGITGVAVIKLAADPGAHAPLEKVGESPFPVIAVRDIGFAALLDNAPLIVERLDAVLVDLNEILSEENRVNIGSTLADLASFSHTLAAQKDYIGALPVLLKQAMLDLNETLARINAIAGKLDPGLESSVANLEQATASLAKMSARMEGWTAANDAAMNAFMGDGLGQLPELMEEAQTTLREARKLLKELRDDPSKLIYQSKEDSVELEH